MAKASSKNRKAKTSAKGMPAIMPLVQIAGFSLAAIGGTLLFAALFDLGFVDLRFELRDFALYAFIVLLAGAGAFAFAVSRAAAEERGKFSAALEAAKVELDDKNASVQTDITLQIATVQEKINTFLGDEYERLKEENAAYREELEQRRSTEIDRTNAEIELLREKNEMLQEKISKWAIDSVDSVVTHDRIHEA